jgi:hypothetical protein
VYPAVDTIVSACRGNGFAKLREAAEAVEVKIVTISENAGFMGNC